ncbi:MAG: hypothetical protein Q4F67_05255, partial [Propionibacteriaceae bacterium]|nr:hypothetical protein [Propionibacteriaceae bacterium]
RTLGCFQIESPGQRELIGKFGPSDFTDIIIDISLFRPGPVKSDMVRPFLDVRQGWDTARYLHPDLEPVLRETCGVVVFHEQVIAMIAILTGCSLAEGDEARRALGDREALTGLQGWFRSAALQRGYAEPVVEAAWAVLAGFGSFGFCKAHAAAFALPTYQSAWLKTHWPAHFLAGVLTHDPGMYPKRLILEEARRSGVEVLGLDVNRSAETYRVEQLAGRWGIRLALAEVKGISSAELARITTGRPYRSLADFWNRADVSRPVTERLVLAGAFDRLHEIRPATSVQRHGRLTRRDLLLAVADLDRDTRAANRASRARARGLGGGPHGVQAIQLPLDFDTDREITASGLSEMTDAERVRAELSVLGLDASRHVVDFYRPMLEALGVSWSKDLLRVRRRSHLLVAGVKVATQAPPLRSGRRVVFLTLDDTTGPVEATFFDDVLGRCARTLFESWLLVVQGDLRRTGPRGVSLRAHGCWDLGALFEVWRSEHELTGDPARALAAVRDLLGEAPQQRGPCGNRAPDHHTY